MARAPSRPPADAARGDLPRAGRRRRRRLREPPARPGARLFGDACNDRCEARVAWSRDCDGAEVGADRLGEGARARTAVRHERAPQRPDAPRERPLRLPRGRRPRPSPRAAGHRLAGGLRRARRLSCSSYFAFLIFGAANWTTSNVLFGFGRPNFALTA